MNSNPGLLKEIAVPRITQEEDKYGSKSVELSALSTNLFSP